MHFVRPQIYPVGSDAESVAMGDFTGDGRRDVAMTTLWHNNEASDFKLFLFVQQPDGRLAAPVKRETHLDNISHAGMDGGDLDGDEDIDVALATEAGVDIFYQHDGGLQPAILLPTETRVEEVVIADIDGSGDNDLITLSYWSGVQVFVNNGSGFDPPFTATEDSQCEIEVGDLSGDGRLDIAGCLRDSMNTYIQQPNGTFVKQSYQATTEFSTSSSGIEVRDLSGDGRADVSMTIGGNRPNSLINVFIQNPSGTFDPEDAYPVYDIPQPLEALDMNADARPDLVTLHGGHQEMGVLLQKPSGSFDEELLYLIPYDTFYNSKGLALGDISGDGLRDIVFASDGNGLVVIRQTIPNVPTSLTLTVSDATVRYKGKVTVTAHLTAPGSPNRSVTIYELPHGLRRPLARRGDVDSSGNFSVSITMLRKTQFDAEYKGAPGFDPSRSNVEVVDVVPIITAELRRHYAVQGELHLYHAGTAPVMKVAVKPRHPRELVLIRAQVKSDGKWVHSPAGGGVELRRDGTVLAELTGTQRGERYRARAVFPGDADHQAVESPWVHLRITR